jgi:hypothetical protein
MKGLVVEIARPAVRGEIHIDKFSEHFYSPLDDWRVDDYLSQWNISENRLSSGKKKACFIIAKHPRSIASFVETWSFWKYQNEYCIQNHILQYQHLPTDFDLMKAHLYIGELQLQTEDGDRIATWRLPVSAFAQ